MIAERKKMSEKCKTCKYRQPPNSGTGNCNYICITYKRRGCPAGDECTKYEKGPRIEKREDIAIWDS